ncbi:MAG: thioesterase family protein [Bdellovibrionaceae bacterium]|nr:thioesterase family protein [Pseudobdellovibrionaceae bacterium]
MLPFKITIKENQVDMLGHLNNAVYLELFEVARWDIIHSKGYGLKKILQLQQGPVLLELNLKFMKEVLAREEITIQSELTNYQGKVGEIIQKMYKSNGDQAAELRVVLGLFDMKTRRLIEPTPEWLAALK